MLRFQQTAGTLLGPNRGPNASKPDRHLLHRPAFTHARSVRETLSSVRMRTSTERVDIKSAHSSRPRCTGGCQPEVSWLVLEAYPSSCAMNVDSTR